MPIHHMAGKHSKQVHWARYNEDTKTLEVDFKDLKNGGKQSTYSYHERLNPDKTPNPPHGFTMAEWRAFQDAPSKGSHFAQYIRNNYRGVKIWSKGQ